LITLIHPEDGETSPAESGLALPRTIETSQDPLPSLPLFQEPSISLPRIDRWVDSSVTIGDDLIRQSADAEGLSVSIHPASLLSYRC
jgi:hypothetical protein